MFETSETKIKPVPSPHPPSDPCLTLDEDGRLRLFGVTMWYISLLLSYMVLPAVSTATLKLFTCKDFRADGGPYVLVDDMSVECGTAEHTTYILFGIVMMLSPIGGTVQR